MSMFRQFASPEPMQTPASALVDDYLREVREVLEYAEAVNTLIKIVATGQAETPDAREEQRQQVELLSESQCEILARLNDVTKMALGSAQLMAGKLPEGGPR